MSAYKRNVVVGVMVLGAVVALGWMMLKFGDLPASFFAEPTIPVQFNTERSDGISEGSPVMYRGVNVGRVVEEPRLEASGEITIDAVVEKADAARIPDNLRGVIRTAGLLGASSAIHLELTEEPSKGWLKDSKSRINATFGSLDLIPPEMAALATELRRTAKQLNDSKLIEHIDEQVRKVGDAVASVQSYLGDPKIRENIEESLVNVRNATARADRIGDNMEKFTTDLQKVSANFDKVTVDAQATFTQARTTISKTEGNIDTLSKQLGDRVQQMADLLEQFQSISRKIDEGKGTAGLLVNDPKLYESLVDTARELNGTISDLKRLVEQWEQEGVSFKLSK